MAWGGGTGRVAVRRSRERNRNWLMQDRELVNWLTVVTVRKSCAVSPRLSLPCCVTWDRF